MAGSVTVTNARIFDGHAADLTEADIRIEDGRIVAIGRDLAEDGPVIDAQDRVVTPGFIDNHFHAYGISLNMMDPLHRGSGTSGQDRPGAQPAS